MSDVAVTAPKPNRRPVHVDLCAEGRSPGARLLQHRGAILSACDRDQGQGVSRTTQERAEGGECLGFSGGWANCRCLCLPAECNLKIGMTSNLLTTDFFH